MYKCNVPATCPYDTTKCTGGYVETGNVCQSGETLYKECKARTCDYNTTECTGGYVETGNTCKSGETLYKECAKVQCGAHARWSETGCSCVQGYENWQEGVGCSLILLDCGENAYQSGTKCNCESGYENWTDGTGCSAIPIECGLNATQQGTKCVCDSGYVNWTEGVGCYRELNCGVNAYQLEDQCVCSNSNYVQWTEGYGCYQQKNCYHGAHQIGNSCECDAGYENWIYGIGCSLTVLNCGARAYQHGTTCVCETGYENWIDGIGCSAMPIECGLNATQQGTKCVCNSGYVNWQEGIGCSQKLECGIHAYQNGGRCECEHGYVNWQEGIGCSVFGIANTANKNNVFINSNDSNSIVGKVVATSIDSGRLYNYSVNNYGVYITKINDSNVAANIIGVKGVKLTYSEASGSSQQDDYNAKNAAGGTGIINIEKSGKGQIIGLQGEANANVAIGSRTNGYIQINNNGNGIIYGIKNQGTASNVEYGGHVQTTPGEQVYIDYPISVGSIEINNINNSSDVYGIYGIYASNIYGTDEPVAGIIKIRNYASGNVYGLYNTSTTEVSYNVSLTNHSYHYYGGASDVTATIDIFNAGNGDTYGIYNGGYNTYVKKNFSAIGYIDIDNTGYGISYGMYNGTPQEKITNAAGGTAIITIHNKSNGGAYGMYATGDVYNAHYIEECLVATGCKYINSEAHGNINIINYAEGYGVGMYGDNAYNETGSTGDSVFESTINIQNLSSGGVIGMSSDGGYISNSGVITINNVGDGDAFGILGEKYSSIRNSGVINITRDLYVDEEGTVYEPTIETSGNVYGIYAKSGSTVNNSGNINIASNGNAYGIYVEGDSTVKNTGTISLNGVACSGADCNTGNYIVLNGSTLVNAGTMSADTLSLNSMGGTVRAATGSRFVATDAITGDLNISSELVSSGNQTTYVAENMIDAGDVSGLNLVSESALFDARLASNGHDVVMTMRGFDEFTDNKSLAAFLEHNYATGNNTDLFGDLKSIGTNAAFMGALNGFSGLGAFNQFANEDLAAMREMNFSMNEQLFETSGRDDVDISGGVNYFSFSNQSGVGSGSYGLSIDRISDKWKMGYGISMANISTGNDDGINRQSTIGLFYMPMTYTNSGYEVIVNPKIGFSRGEYNRQGFNNMSYEGYIEKRIFGLMNDIRYPLTFGNWTVAPNLGLNAIVYNQSGHEENKMYGLIIPDSNLVSVEAGLGLYAKYDRTFADNSKLSFNTGLMAYREFGDCYNIKLGIRGMDGTFDLYDNNLYDYRGAATIGFKYNSGRLNLYGNAQYFTDSDSYMNLKAGIRFAF